MTKNRSLVNLEEINGSYINKNNLLSEAEDENCVNGQYLCHKKLGSGGFGEVWSCIDIIAQSRRPEGVPFESEEFIYAMKIENLLEPTEEEKKQGVTKRKPVPEGQSQLVYEHKMYKILCDGIGIPTVHWFGRHK